MCVLRLSSKDYSFKLLIENTELSLFSVFDSGEDRGSVKPRVCEENFATLRVSDKEWNDIQGQIEDAISFFKRNKNHLVELFGQVKDLNASLDFPVLSKFDGHTVTHGITFPSQLTTLAGNLKLTRTPHKTRRPF